MVPTMGAMSKQVGSQRYLDGLSDQQLVQLARVNGPGWTLLRAPRLDPDPLATVEARVREMRSHDG
jgi:hypothetical protein